MAYTISEHMRNKLNAAGTRSLAASSIATETTKKKKKNKGGLLGGLGYTLGQLGTGIFGVGEGIYDFVVGGIADIIGQDEYTKRLLADDITGRWQEGLNDWYNPSSAMQFVGDVAGGLGQTAAYVGLNLIPVAGQYLSTGAMFTSAAGRGVTSAYQKTGKLGAKEWLYGLGSGTVEAGLELATGTVGKIAGSITGASKSVAKTAVRSGILRSMWDAGKGEFVEEALSEFIDPYLQKATIDPNAKNASLQEIIRAGAVGFVSGAVGGAAGTGIGNARNAYRGNRITKTGNTDFSLQDRKLGERTASSGSTDTVLQRAQTLLSKIDNAQNAETVAGNLLALKGTYDAYNNLTNKNGIRGQMLLGEMARNIAYTEISGGVEASKADIKQHADTLAQYLTDQKGQTYTAEDIKNNKDGILTDLAIADFSAKMIINPDTALAMVKRGEMGVLDMASQYEAWRGNLTAEQLQEANTALGIDLSTSTFQDFNKAMGAFNASNQQQSSIETRKAQAQPMPDSISLQEGETAVYKTDSGEYLAVKRDSEGYLIAADDANGNGLGKSAKHLTEEQANELVKGVKQGEKAPTETSKVKEVKAKMEAAALTEEGRSMVKDFDNLPASTQARIREMIATGQKFNSVSKSDMEFVANLMAKRGGVSFAFADFGEDGLNGLFTTTEKGKRFIQLNANNSSEAIKVAAVHELAHELRKSNAVGYESLSKAALKLLSKDELEEIKTAYTEFYKQKDVDTESKEFADLLDDEYQAHAMQKLFGKKQFLERYINYENKGIVEQAKGVATKLSNKFKGVFFPAYRQYDKLIKTYEAILAMPSLAEVKSVEENKSAERYSISIDGKETMVDVEEGKNLVALHNLSESNLLRVIELGGFPMPSIAVTTTELPHENYGDITVVFGRDTIDPETDTRNVVYDRDAWTPTTPTVDVKLNNDKVVSLVKELQSNVGDNSTFKRSINNFFDGKYRDNNGDYIIPENEYTKDLVGERAIKNSGIVASYLGEKGITVEPVYAERGFNMGWTSFTRKEAENLLSYVGITKDITRDNATPEQRENILERFIEYRAKEKLGLMRRFKKNPNLTIEDAKESLRKDYNDGNVSQLFFMAEDVFDESRPKDVYDEHATIDKMNEAITDKQDFYGWFWDKIEGTFEKKGIDNDSDVFDRRGNRRSFEQRHFAYTAANIVKAMAKGEQEGKAAWGISAGALAAKLSQQFESIEDIRAAKKYLALVSEEDLKAFNDQTYELYDELVTYIAGQSSDFLRDSSRRDDVGEILGKCAAVKPLTVDNIKRVFDKETKGYNLGYKFNEKTARQALTLFQSLQHVPTTYFEAKPRRVVDFDEIQTVLIPETSSQKLKDSLDKNNISWQTYKGENTRSKILKDLDNARFSIKIGGENVGLIDNFDLSSYNEITVSDEEMARLSSEALKWDGRERNVIKTRTLSNGYSYVYLLDEDSNIHIFEREIAENIHEEKEYVNQNKEKSFRFANFLKIQNGQNNGRSIPMQNGREYGQTVQYDGGLLQGKGQGVGRRRSKDDFNNQGTSKKIKRITFNDDGSQKVIYSDGTTETRLSIPTNTVVRNKEYMDAVNRNDMETAQRMVDEAAKEAGYKEHLYHGTNADFTKFDLRKHGGRNGKGEGYGIYLAANREISAPYGKNIIDSYVKFNRLAEGRKKTLSYNEVKSLVKRSCEIEAQRMVDDEEYDSLSEALRDTWVSNIVYTYDYSNISQVYADVANKLWKENDNDGDLINEIMALSGAHYDYNNALDFYDNILTPITGIDGFHYIWGNKDGSGEQNDIYLAFRSNQIKSADPVTYDDNGDVIPLSERFKSDNEDIRYSISYAPTGKTAIAMTTKQDKRAWKDRLREAYQRTRINFINRQAAIEDTFKALGVEDGEAYVQAARAAGSQAQHAIGGYIYDVTKFQSEGKGNILSKGIDMVMQPVRKANLEAEFFDYLFNLHNIDRLKVDKPVNGNTAEESQQAIKEAEKAHPEFKEWQKDWSDMVNALMTLRLNAGLITQEQYDYLTTTYPHYVPTFREEGGKQGSAGDILGRYDLSVKRTIRKATGSTDTLLRPDEMIARQTLETYRAIAVNNLINRLYEAGLLKGSTDFEIVSREKMGKKEATGDMGDIVNLETVNDTKPNSANNTITFYKDGEKITLKVSKNMFEGFEGLHPGQSEFSDDLVLTGLRKVMNAFKAGVTNYNPTFLFRNAIRDIQDAGLYTKNGFKFYKTIYSAEKEMIGNGKVWQLFVAAGGMNASIFDSQKGFTGSFTKRGFNALEGRLGKKALQGMENLNMYVELLPRFTEFMASLNAGKTVNEALLDSANVTVNFGRSGKITKIANAYVVPFLNAAVQGASNTFKTFRNATTFKKFASLITRCIVLGIAPAVLSNIMYGDDEEYQNLRTEDKQNYYLFKVGDKFIKLPRGRLAALLAGATIRTDMAMKGEEDAWDGFGKSAYETLTPIESASRFIWSPFQDVKNNVTWYGSAIEGREFENKAVKDRYDESTSSIAIWLGKSKLAQELEYSPKKIHYLIDQYAGVIGDILLPATTKKAEKGMFSGNFTIDPITSNKLSTKFYKIYDETNYAKNAGDETAALKLRYLNKVKASVSELYKEKDAIQASNLSDKEKLLKTKAVQVLINEAYKNAVNESDLWTNAFAASEGLGDNYTVVEVTKKNYKSLQEKQESIGSYVIAYNGLTTGKAYATEEKAQSGLKSMISDYRFVEGYRLMQGTEAALMNYSDSAYEKAKSLTLAGIDYDNFYNAYFYLKQYAGDATKKREYALSVIESLDLTKQQRLMMIYALGYSVNGELWGMSSKTARTTIARYINSLRIKKDEKIALAQACGLTVKNGKIVIKS